MTPPVTLRRTVAAAGAATLLLTACGSTEQPAAAPASSSADVAEATEPVPEVRAEAVTQTADVAATTTAAPPPEAQAGALAPDLRVDVARVDVSQPAGGVFGTPDGTVEIHSVSRADTVPGHVLGESATELVPAAGEEFFVVDLGFVRGEDQQTPPTELHLESQGTRQLVAQLTPGERSVLASLPASGEGASLVVSADGHEQVFDLATGARVADPVTDTYLRRVVQQDLTDVLRYGPVAGDDEDRTFTADLGLRSARITPYVPPQVGSERWAEPGSMWLILSYRLDYAASRHGWSDKHATLTWTADDAEPVVQEGRLWGKNQTVVISIPAELESFEVAVANQAELGELGEGRSVKDFGTQSFSLSFPKD